MRCGLSADRQATHKQIPGSPRRLSGLLAMTCGVCQQTDDLCFVIDSSYSLDTHMNLDLDLALRKDNNNPVYYVQYAYARIHSILDKSGINEDYHNLKGFMNYK